MRKACEKGGRQFTEDGLHLTCRRGDAYLVLMMEDSKIETAVVIQPQQWANMQVLHVLAATGGDRTGWWEPMVAWGRETFPGCSHLIFDGRPGWGRMPGVKVLRHVFEVDL